MFDPDDPLLHRIRAIALSFPGAAEKVSHGRPTFYTTKVFVYYGASIKIDGEWIQHPESFVIHPDDAELAALEAEERCYRPGYLGPSGWIGVDLTDDTDWAEVRELIEASYRETAPVRLIAELDARSLADGDPEAHAER